MMPIVDEKTGVERIAAERKKQIEVYRWDDSGNNHFQLTDCALMIAQDVAAKQVEGLNRPDGDNYWPAARAEHIREKYGDDIISRLAIAGALIAAEIDRLQGTPFESLRAG